MAATSEQQALAASSLLRELPEESLARLAAVARRRSYRRGDIVCHQGDPGDTLHVIASGRVKVMVYSEFGEEALLTFLGPGDAFGELALISGQPRSATVQAVEATETIALRRDDFLDLIHTHPQSPDALLVTLAATIRRLTDEVSDLVFRDLGGRLAKKLLDLSEQYGRPTGEGLEIELPITQEELATMVGATRTSVNKVLGWFEDSGAIQRQGRRFVITDAERLRRRIV